MPQTKKQIQAALAEAGSEPRHRFGQNFMIDGNLVRLVADAGLLTAEDTAIEIGPGTGTLTEELLSRAAQVIAVEIDRDLAALLRQRFADEPRFTLVEGDALAGKHALNPQLLTLLNARCKLVANLPYNIASPLVIEMLIAGVPLLAFTVQKEVADRLRAAAGHDAYGPLSIMAQLLADVEVLRMLPPQAFWPAPKIDSALVRMIAKPTSAVSDVRAFSRFVHQLFSFRRKTLRNALTQSGIDASDALKKSSLDGHLRPEMYTPMQLMSLFDVIDIAA
ncbi:MAG: ribosomal RNA small subunit methyltransferase A, partial [Phycisphaerae bacterium]|nr:ribosomal RNA small subunit methyltransferase A [Phycisphaerae bacterium]